MTQGSAHGSSSPSAAHLPVSSSKKAVEAKCSLACEYLSEEDYMDLLWTTLSEFPGEGRMGSGAGARKPGNVAAIQCHSLFFFFLPLLAKLMRFFTVKTVQLL